MFFVRLVAGWLYRLSDSTVRYGRLPVVKPGLLVPDWTPGARTETSAPGWRRNLGPRALDWWLLARTFVIARGRAHNLTGIKTGFRTQ